MSDKISLLIKKITFLSEKYYESGTSPVSDAVFDALIEELRSIDSNHPILSKTGWGYVITDGVEHPYHEITGIAHKYKSLGEVIVDPTATWHVMPKLDGASVILYYKNGVIQNCVTRGDGLQGRDVTKNIMTRIPLRLQNSDLTGYIRCEVVISKYNFDTHFPAGRSLRNTATGLMGAQTPEPTLVQYLDVIPVSSYSTSEGFSYPGMNSFKKQVSEFPVNLNFKIVTSDLQKYLSKDTMEELGNKYLCDGIVVVSATQGTPVKTFAYKFDDEIKETVITKVEWVTQDTGKMFPTIHYEPTEISGCMASKASGKSYDFIQKNGIATGAKIELVRSGEIIPNVHKVLEPKPVEVLRCQYGCDPEYVEIEGAHAYCRAPTCPAVTLGMFKRLILTFAPKTFADSMLDALIQRFNGNVFALLEELKKWEKEKTLQIDVPELTERGKKMVEEIFLKIMGWKLTLAQLADIAIVEYFGDSQSKAIESKASTNMELTTWCKNAVTVPEEYSINSKAIENWARRHHVIKMFLDYFILVVPKKKDLRAYKGLVCITGKIESMKKSRFAELYIESQGYKWVEDIKDATILVDAEGKESSKIKTAKKRGIKIVPIEQWIKGGEWLS